ncbi:MAG: Uncharacterized protein FD189_1077 [Elusimicrobia bacterium]|nr:MAG: Uncharacterized protein FD189_1077 [Elusimicrobiota bacterium]
MPDRISALRAPFPWFGGKRRVAHLVWPRFGDVPNYVEPFAGSLAVLLARPEAWPPRKETVNDLDCYLANFWRAVAADPEAVARWADWPVNEADLHARHRWLHARKAFREKMHRDPEHFDAKIAGWWAWGISCWIGDNWCRPETQKARPEIHGARGVQSAAVLGPSSGSGIGNRRPHLTTKGGAGVHAQRLTGDGSGLDLRCPVLTPGQGVHSQRPVLERGSRGVGSCGGSGKGPECMKRIDLRKGGRGRHRKMPELKGNRGGGALWQQVIALAKRPNITGYSLKGVHRPTLAQSSSLLEYMLRLAERLRRVRVCCGDWSRILGSSPTIHIGVTAVFLDPPYGAAGRDKVYNHDSLELAGAVRQWCVEHGPEPRLRIALCGYEGEHNELEALGWDKLVWKAGGGYGARRKANLNAHRERIWFSPGCLKPEGGGLFAAEAAHA